MNDKKNNNNEKATTSPPLKNQLVVVNLNKKAPEPPKLGEVIMELDEEHENYHSDKKHMEELQ
jgi:hypothetical protein